MKQYIVDAFTEEVFKGNQAAVCVMEEWIPEERMQKIAIENNFAETAFVVKGNGDATREGSADAAEHPEHGREYELRWFTPGGEIDLCGHATLGSAYVLFRFYEKDADEICFHTRWKGELFITKNGNLIGMDFPKFELKEIPVTDEMEQAFGARPTEAYIDRDLLAVFEDPDIVKNMAPDQELLKNLPGLIAGVTAPGEKYGYDSVSRVFAPKLKVAEDPVTGSTHCMITPYWTERLEKKAIAAFQASERTGVLHCTMAGDRVKLEGSAALYSVGDILTDWE